MSNTICKYLAGEVRGNGRLLSYCLETTKCDLNWKPSIIGEGRSMLEQADEVAKLNLVLASYFKGGKLELSEQPMITEPGQASAAVMKSAGALADALEGMQDSDLEKNVALPFGNYAAKTAIGIANMNMAYH